LFRVRSGLGQGGGGKTPRAIFPAPRGRVDKAEGGAAKATLSRYRAADASKDIPTPESRASAFGWVQIPRVLETL